MREVKFDIDNLINQLILNFRRKAKEALANGFFDEDIKVIEKTLSTEFKKGTDIKNYFKSNYLNDYRCDSAGMENCIALQSAYKAAREQEKNILNYNFSDKNFELDIEKECLTFTLRESMVNKEGETIQQTLN